ncbi:hypothetical protein ACGF8B_30410 [Streptomyces sp. NPDC047917]|uniref:hypothetical protein n=1 Tax=Streptomyces sp. NPDC047917 TaxID=3365491 RepID=UPI0037249A6B
MNEYVGGVGRRPGGQCLPVRREILHGSDHLAGPEPRLVSPVALDTDRFVSSTADGQ